MKKKLTIKGIFNDEFTGYKDKESSISMVVDPEEDCKCTYLKICWLCRNIEKFGLTEIDEK